jgi:hypothetical protein
MRTRDDRGRLVKVIPAYLLAGAGVLWCALNRTDRRAVQARVQGGGWREFILPTLTWIAAMAMLLPLTFELLPRPAPLTTARGWVTPIVQGLIIPLSMLPVMYVGAWRMRARVARCIIAEGCCATCGYSLQGTQMEPDGCFVCPECGSAWKHVPRIRPRQ